MKLILISDLHLLTKKPVARLDDVVETCYEKLYFVMKRAYDLKAPVLVAGDFFDKPRDWYIWQRLRLTIAGVKIYSVFGQHDTYKYSEKTRSATNLGVLAELSDDVTILGPKPCHELGVRIYGAHVGQPVPKVEQNEFTNILVIHASISTVENIYVEHNAVDFLADHADYDLILCGDIHKKFIVKGSGNHRIICNTGPMIRKSVDDWDHQPCFFIYDTTKKDVKEVEIPHKPPEEVLSRDHIESKKKRNELLHDFISQVKSKKAQSTNIVRNINRFVRENEIPKQTIEILAEVMQNER